MTTRNSGVNENDDQPYGISEDEGADAFLNRWLDADDKLSDEARKGEQQFDDEDDRATDQSTNEDDDEDEDLLLEEDEEGSDNEDESSEPDQLKASDDHLVEVTVDGETQTVSVKELKRLFGQEASLTRKSQEVAEARKAAQTEAERAVVVSQRMLEKAEARFKPYENIDWMIAQQRLTVDEFAALRQEAKAAYDDLQYIKADTDEFLKTVEEQRRGELATAAKQAIEVLQKDIPGWNREVYDNIRTYAVESGMDADVVNSIVDPAAIKLIHKAMRYDTLKAKAASKKTKVTNAAAKKVVKPTGRRVEQANRTNTRADEALKRLGRSGNSDDAANAFLAKWSSDED